MISMWFLLALLCGIMYVNSKPANPIERQRWLENTAREEILGAYLEQKPENYEMFLPENIENTLTNADLDDYFQQPSQKRALTMFGRWGPINELGKERSSIRSTDRIHSSTGRKMGQPFRWG